MSGRPVEEKQPDEDGLRAVYETERRDEQNTAALIIAVTTGTLAYFAAASAYMADRTRQKTIAPEVLMAAPFPLLILTGYVTFQYAASRIRQSYLMYLEEKLSRGSWANDVQYPGFMTLHQGLFSDWGKLFPFAALTILTFFSHVVIVVGFTGYAAYVAYKGHPNVYEFWSLAGFYTLVVLVNIAAVLMMIEYTVNPNSRVLKWLRERACTTARNEENRWRNSVSQGQVK